MHALKSTTLIAVYKIDYVCVCVCVQFRQEFKMVISMDESLNISSLMENWPTWKNRILAYSRLEMKNRPKLKHFLSLLDNESTSENDEGEYM